MGRKILFIVSLFCIAISSVLFGCTPEKLENVVGTYKLTVDTVTVYEKDKVDKIADSEIEAYLVVTGEEKGYYVFKSKYEPLNCKEINLTYVKNTNVIISIRYNTKVGEKPTTLNVDSKEKVTLGSHWYQANKIQDAYEIEYEKVSGATDLSYVKELYPELPVFSYGTYDYDGHFYARILKPNANFADYIYHHYDIDAANGTATEYYALKADKTPVKNENLKVTFEKSGEFGKLQKIIIGDTEYSLENKSIEREITVDIQGVEADVREVLYKSSMFSSDSEGLIYENYEELFHTMIEEYERSAAAKEGE